MNVLEELQKMGVTGGRSVVENNEQTEETPAQQTAGKVNDALTQLQEAVQGFREAAEYLEEAVASFGAALNEAVEDSGGEDE